MTRSAAIQLMKSYLQTDNLQKHSLAVGAIMRALAIHFDADPELWDVVGILHDLDYELTSEHPEQHGYQTLALLAQTDNSLPAEALDAIQVHPGHGPRNTLLARALYAADPLSGLIMAGAFMHPHQLEMPLKSIKKRYKDKRFAAGANREQIACCSELHLSLDEFFTLALTGMKEVAHELGF